MNEQSYVRILVNRFQNSQIKRIKAGYPSEMFINLKSMTLEIKCERKPPRTAIHVTWHS